MRLQMLVGGENVYCSEVEATLHAHPRVAAASAFGAPSALLGEVVAAAVVLREEAMPGGTGVLTLDGSDG